MKHDAAESSHLKGEEMMRKYAGVILSAVICVSLAITALIADKNTEIPSDKVVSETNASMEDKNAKALPDEVILEPITCCTNHTPWNLIKTEWVDAQKDDLISNGHYEKEIVWALCKDCGTPFFYETGEKRAIKPSDDEGYAVNTAGQTYGSALFARSREEHPDLISAVGNHGTVGYIYASDLDAGEPITLSEALAQQAKIEELIEECAGEDIIVFRTIPLYDVDGITILDEYNISFASSSGL